MKSWVAVLSGALLVLIFVAGVAGGIWFFRHPGKEYQGQSFFAILQFVASFSLIGLTFLYVRVVQQQLRDQNRPPRFIVTYCHLPSIDPPLVQFEVEIANPAGRATSVGIKTVRVGDVQATNASFSDMQPRSIVPAAGLARVTIDASFESMPISLETIEAALVFDDVFHGDLPAIRYSMKERNS